MIIYPSIRLGPKNVLPLLSADGLVVYSSHDSTITNLLSLLLTKVEIEDLGLAKMPPFGSILFFEFWENDSGTIEVQIKYNKRVNYSLLIGNRF